jgi:hypothetical protein
LAPGISKGVAVLHQPDITITQLVAEDPLKEIERLDEAMSGMKLALDEMLATSDVASGGEHREVLETYRMFAEDRGWANRIVEAIETGLTAEAAVQKVQNDTRARMREITDPYLRERLADLDDLANRLQRHLLGQGDIQQPRDLPDETILVARNMGPAELLDYDRKKLRGVVLEEGTATAHVAIVARALDIPILRPLQRSHGQGAARRSADRRWRQCSALCAAIRGHCADLCGGDAPAQRAPVGLRRDPPPAGGDSRRHRSHADGQCRPADRRAADRGAGCGRHRALSHRDHLHGGAELSRRGAAARCLQAGDGCQQRQAGGLPHPRYRQRQGALLLAARFRREPGDGLARDPHLARSTGRCFANSCAR